MGHKKNTRPQINILPLLVHSTHPNPHFTLLSVYLVLHTTSIFSCCVLNFLLVDRRRRRGSVSWPEPVCLCVASLSRCWLIVIVGWWFGPIVDSNQLKAANPHCLISPQLSSSCFAFCSHHRRRRLPYNNVTHWRGRHDIQDMNEFSEQFAFIPTWTSVWGACGRQDTQQPVSHQSVLLEESGRWEEEESEDIFSEGEE